MALDVWFRDDIERSLLAAMVVTVETAQANGLANREHLGGALMFAKGMSLAFGVPWLALEIEARAALGGDAAGLLDEVARGAIQA